MGLRMLFDMEQLPGPVEDEKWDDLWEFVYVWPFMMLSVVEYYQTLV